MRKIFLILAVLVLALISVNAAKAESMTFSLTGNGLTASGAFYGSPVTSGQWLLTGVTGAFNGSAIMGIEPLANNGNVFAFNNIVGPRRWSISTESCLISQTAIE